MLFTAADVQVWCMQGWSRRPRLNSFRSRSRPFSPLLSRRNLGLFRLQRLHGFMTNLRFHVIHPETCNFLVRDVRDWPKATSFVHLRQTFANLGRYRSVPEFVMKDSMKPRGMLPKDFTMKSLSCLVKLPNFSDSF